MKYKALVRTLQALVAAQEALGTQLKHPLTPEAAASVAQEWQGRLKLWGVQASPEEVIALLGDARREGEARPVSLASHLLARTWEALVEEQEGEVLQAFQCHRDAAFLALHPQEVVTQVEYRQAGLVYETLAGRRYYISSTPDMIRPTGFTAVEAMTPALEAVHEAGMERYGAGVPVKRLHALEGLLGYLEDLQEEE